MAQKKVGIAVNRKQEVIQAVKARSQADEVAVPMIKLYKWREVSRRTVYFKPTKSARDTQEQLERAIKDVIESEPSYRHRSMVGPCERLHAKGPASTIAG